MAKTKEIGKWEDIRKYGLILTIAILYAIFSHTLINAALQEPEYNTHGCYYDQPKYYGPGPVNCTPAMRDSVSEQACHRQGGVILEIYNNSACPTAYECSMCQKEFDTLLQRHELKVFILSAILAGLSIIAGFLLPFRQNIINEWVGSGLIFGGLFTLFFGTARSFGQIGEIYRPIIILAELILVIYLAYRLYGRNR